MPQDDWAKRLEIKPGKNARVLEKQTLPLCGVSYEENDVLFNPTSTRDKILQSVLLIFILYAIYMLFFHKSIWIMLFLMAHALLGFYFYFVRCHDVVYTDYWDYYRTTERVGWCRNKDKKGCINPGYLFSWNDVPGDNNRLLNFLSDCPYIGWWAKNAEIHKTDDGKTIKIFKDENWAEITIDEEKEKATLKINNGRTQDLKVKKENGKLNIYVK
ncbi:MAG: hypothetical protein U9N41_02310 [Euryarchaeota archaeon]|nr:hypothetical protein [Euryarchaeota archaeon]